LIFTKILTPTLIGVASIIENKMTIENNEKILESYLIFQLGREQFAAHVSKISSIIQIPTITKIPKAPLFMKGIIQFHGTSIPLIDTRIRFGMPATETNKNTVIIILEIKIGLEMVSIAALVDSVQEVLEINEADIFPLPDLGNKYKSEFILGVLKSDKSFIMLLDLDSIFQFDELEILSNEYSDITEVLSEA